MLNEGPLPPRRALDIFLQVAEGIASAHAAHMVHRDIKPENLMVSRDGVVKILDFGLAKLTRPGEATGDADVARTAVGMVVGTAGYLSPEQLRGERASERSDVFALGVVLYEMIAGVNPFQRNNAVETFSAILRDEAPPLGDRATPELSALLDRALAKKPEDRFPTAQEFGADLARVRASMPSAAPVPSPEPLPGSGRGRSAALAAAIVLALAAGAFFLLRGC